MISLYNPGCPDIHDYPSSKSSRFTGIHRICGWMNSILKIFQSSSDNFWNNNAIFEIRETVQISLVVLLPYSVHASVSQDNAEISEFIQHFLFPCAFIYVYSPNPSYLSFYPSSYALIHTVVIVPKNSKQRSYIHIGNDWKASVLWNQIQNLFFICIDILVYSKVFITFIKCFRWLKNQKGITNRYHRRGRLSSPYSLGSW
jgi:hypothetical protein